MAFFVLFLRKRHQYRQEHGAKNGNIVTDITAKNG